MREKIAEIIYAGLINTDTWQEKVSDLHDYAQVKTDQILTLFKQELDKALLTDEGILNAADKACDNAEKEGKCKAGDSCMDCSEREKAVAKAQLDNAKKILES